MACVRSNTYARVHTRCQRGSHRACITHAGGLRTKVPRASCMLIPEHVGDSSNRSWEIPRDSIHHGDTPRKSHRISAKTRVAINQCTSLYHVITARQRLLALAHNPHPYSTDSPSRCVGPLWLRTMAAVPRTLWAVTHTYADTLAAHPPL